MTATGRPVEAVIFDWGGTLTPWHTVDLPRAVARLRARGARHPVDRPDMPGTTSPRPTRLAAHPRGRGRAAWRRGRDEHAERLARRHPRRGRASTPSTTGTTWRSRPTSGFWEPHTFTDPQVRPLWEGLHAQGHPGRRAVQHDLDPRLPPRASSSATACSTCSTPTSTPARSHVREAAPRGLPRGLPTRSASRRGAASTSATGSSRTSTARSRSGMRAILVPHSDIPAGQQVRGRRRRPTPSPTSCSTCSTSSTRWNAAPTARADGAA